MFIFSLLLIPVKISINKKFFLVFFLLKLYTENRKHDSKTAREKRNQALEYAEKHEVDSSVLLTVAGAANYNIDYNALSRKGGSVMYSVFEETKEEGRIEGIAEGMAKGMIQMGMDCNLPKNQILEKLQKNMDISLQKAEEYFQVYQSQSSSLQ